MNAIIIIAWLLIIEGISLLVINNDMWRRLCEQLLKLTIGQIHTVGAIMAAIGVALLLFAYI